VLKEALATPPGLTTLAGLPALLPSIRNWTVPLGVPPPGETIPIRAVKVTLCPNTAALAEELTTRLVAALVTVWVRAAAVLPEKLVSPLYEAVTVWVAAARAVLKEAVVTPPALLTLTGLPALLPSTMNCTVPLGAPAPGAVTLTVAVKLMLWPDTEGLTEELTTVLVAARLTVWVREPVLVEKPESPE
jgi:hypothetical protein